MGQGYSPRRLVSIWGRLRPVIVYERSGRYYVADDDDRGEPHYRDGHHQDHDDD